MEELVQAAKEATPLDLVENIIIEAYDCIHDSQSHFLGEVWPLCTVAIRDDDICRADGLGAQS